METAIKTKMTFHAQVERLDRLAACIERLGVGEVALEAVHNGVRFRLTSTGLCLIYAVNEETLITGCVRLIDALLCTAPAAMNECRLVSLRR